MFSSGGVLCRFSVGVKESERQRCGHALTHRSLHVQGEHFCLKHCNLGEMKSNVKLVQIQIMVIMILKLNNVKFTMIQPG